VVALAASGAFASRVELSSPKVVLTSGERFDVPVGVDGSFPLPAGPHECVVDVTAGDTTTTASTRIDVAEIARFQARLEPTASRSSRSGRHTVVVENLGNTPMTVGLTAHTGPEVIARFASTELVTEPGDTGRCAVHIDPVSRRWSGATETHDFAIDATGTMGDPVQLHGSYEQTPRVPSWFGPAMAGMLAALVIGVILWFLLLRPAVEDIAAREAGVLDTAQQQALDEQVAAIEDAAADAARLPLGEPTDLRLSVAAATGNEAVEAFDFDRSGTGRTLSISDVIFQNPSGAVGTVELLRDGEVLLGQEMANFRDLDFHLVAPFRVESGSTISLRVVCTAPGPGLAECEVAATIVGFVDDGD
jgi:hypothetical protein